MRTGLCVTVFAAAAMLWLVVPAQAQETGNVSGRVVDPEGNGVAEVQVRLMEAPQRERQRERDREQAARPLQEQERPARPGRPGGADRPERPAPVATAVTDANGNFTMNNVPAGRYMVAAGGRPHGMGRAPVEVQANETANVTITLAPRPEGRPGPGGEDERPRRRGGQE
jgi:hypothetical protein